MKFAPTFDGGLKVGERRCCSQKWKVWSWVSSSCSSSSSDLMFDCCPRKLKLKGVPFPIEKIGGIEVWACVNSFWAPAPGAMPTIVLTFIQFDYLENRKVYFIGALSSFGLIPMPLPIFFFLAINLRHKSKSNHRKHGQCSVVGAGSGEVWVVLS